VESQGGFQSLHLRQIGGGRTIELVPPERTGYWGVAFTRDGQSIMCGWRSGAEPIGTLYRIPVLGGRPDRILTNIESRVTFSPDGKRMAFYRSNPADRSSAIVVASIDGGDQQEFSTKKPPESTRQGSSSRRRGRPTERRLPHSYATAGPATRFSSPVSISGGPPAAASPLDYRADLYYTRLGNRYE
jgi:hypothetical protein